MAMNQDPISANSGSRQSPSRGYVSPGSDSRPKSSQKRASRAGTRSVTTLSAAQLERKRANDREAQRAIRQRTKDHIESLERRINELNVMNETREKVMVATQQRNRELEQEVSYLRSRLGNDVFTLSVSEAEGKGDKTSDYNVTASSTSPQTQPVAGTIARPPSTSTNRSMPLATPHPAQHSEAWRQHSAFTPAAAPTATPYLHEANQPSNGSSPASWRAQDVNDSQATVDQGTRSFPPVSAAANRNSWAGSGPGYGFPVRTERANYAPPAQALSYAPHSQPQFQTIPSAPIGPPPVGAAFHTPSLASQAEYHAMPPYSATQQGSNFNDQQQGHGAYQVNSTQIPSARDFQNAASNVHRTGLGPPSYAPTGGSPHFLPAQNHAQGIQIGYREGADHHQYNYDS